jgi:hypothetical protein
VCVALAPFNHHPAHGTPLAFAFIVETFSSNPPPSVLIE